MQDMEFFDDKESCEIVIVDNDEEFRDFLDSNPRGLALLPEKHPRCDDLVMRDDVGDFSKWLSQNKPELNVKVHRANKRLMLRSSDYWLPLVFLASDVTLPFYLNLVTSYVYDRMRGALKGEEGRVHLKVMYKDDEEGIIKKFIFDGNVDGLKTSN